MNLKETLEFYNIKSIWHFTDRSNLESIEKYGLLSLDLIEKQKIEVSCFGANELSHQLDRRIGFHKFVHLCLIRDHPMFYCKTKNREITDPIWLEIDISVLLENECGCCDGVANAKNSRCYSIEYLDKFIDLKTLLSNPHWSHPIRKSEILVPNKIDYNKILGVFDG